MKIKIFRFQSSWEFAYNLSTSAGFCEVSAGFDRA